MKVWEAWLSVDLRVAGRLEWLHKRARCSGKLREGWTRRAATPRAVTDWDVKVLKANGCFQSQVVKHVEG